MPGTTALLLAGGQSSRLFPFNKVLSDLTGTGRTLLQQSYDRVKPLAKNGVYVLSARAMAKEVKRQLKLPASRVLADPVRRGTWPAILWAMAHVRRDSADTVLAVVTGDHVIQNMVAFRDAMRKALQAASERPAFVMLGIPTSKDPGEWRGFGCLRTDNQGRVTAFQEKPTSEVAQQMMQEGGWLWNSGMFFFRLSVAEDALRRLQPDMFRVYERVAQAVASKNTAEAELFFQDFPDKIPHPFEPSRYVDNSIDYAIMTPLVARPESGFEAVAIHPIRFRWTDLGQWGALASVVKKDAKGNVRVGDVVRKGDVRDSILVAEDGRSMEVDGIRGIVVAFAGRTALVASLGALSQVKEAAQVAIQHADRVVMEHDVTSSDIRVSGGRVVAIGLSGLSIQLKGRRLVVSSKRGVVR